MVVVVVVVVVGGGLVGRGGGLTMHASDNAKLIPGQMWKYIKSMIMDASSGFTKNDGSLHPRLVMIKSDNCIRIIVFIYFFNVMTYVLSRMCVDMGCKIDVRLRPGAISINE